MKELSNLGRWGDDDEPCFPPAAANLAFTPKRKQALRLAKEAWPFHSRTTSTQERRGCAFILERDTKRTSRRRSPRIATNIRARIMAWFTASGFGGLSHESTAKDTIAGPWILKAAAGFPKVNINGSEMEW